MRGLNRGDRFKSSGIDAWPESRRDIVVVYRMLAMCVQVGLRPNAFGGGAW